MGRKTVVQPTIRSLARKPVAVSVYAYDVDRTLIEAKRLLRRLKQIPQHVSHVGTRPAAEEGVAGCGVYEDERCANDFCEVAMDAQAAIERLLSTARPPVYGEDR